MSMTIVSVLTIVESNLHPFVTFKMCVFSSILSTYLLTNVSTLKIPSYNHSFTTHVFYIARVKNTTMTPFVVSHCTTFQECACLNVSHFKLLKDFHNIFAYYVKI
jgi:hypothetical protein